MWSLGNVAKIEHSGSAVAMTCFWAGSLAIRIREGHFGSGTSRQARKRKLPRSPRTAASIVGPLEPMVQEAKFCCVEHVAKCEVVKTKSKSSGEGREALNATQLALCFTLAGRWAAKRLWREKPWKTEGDPLLHRSGPQSRSLETFSLY